VKFNTRITRTIRHNTKKYKFYDMQNLEMLIFVWNDIDLLKEDY